MEMAYPNRSQALNRDQYAVEYIREFESGNLKVKIKPVLSLAVPTKNVMVKIMRACIGVMKIEDLWISE